MTVRQSGIVKALIGPGIFVFAALYIYWIAGDILELAGDEGIYLAGGMRIALHQQPYRDFFVLTGPLTFWIEGILARVTHLNLPAMRLPMILELAFLAWAVYRLLARYAGAAYSAGAALAFLVYESRFRLLNVNHRWDSGALAVAAILAAIEARRSNRRWLWIFCGALTAAAAWATPSMAILAAPLLLWSFHDRFSGVFGFVCGGALASATAALYLAAHRALLPMIQALRWTAANYTAPNRVFYGSVWAGAAPDIPLWQYLMTGSLLAIPAVLPPLAIAGCIWLSRTREQRADLPEMLPLTGCVVALTLAAWPRWTSDTLLHTLAPSWFLCALLLHRLATVRQRYWCCGIVLLGAAASFVGKVTAPLNYSLGETRAGVLREADDAGAVLDGLERWVQPGDSLFSFPYLPSAYFYLDARNPTRYSFLQPGMMTMDDEQKAVEELQSAPPKWVIYEYFPPAAVFSIWPGSDPARIPMAAMNAYLREHYRAVDTLSGPRGRLTVMERMTPVR